ncbi:hypothetical protein P4S72_28825 [Vibrio sp. PP-XX7]
MDKDSTVYHAMNGPTEFHVIGSMKDWTIISRLHQITVPTLLISGHFDEATRETVQPYMDRIPTVEWEVFPESSHMPHVEERTACMQRIEQFLQPTGFESEPTMRLKKHRMPVCMRCFYLIGSENLYRLRKSV